MTGDSDHRCSATHTTPAKILLLPQHVLLRHRQARSGTFLSGKNPVKHLGIGEEWRLTDLQTSICCSLRTSLSVRFRGETVACGIIFLAARRLQVYPVLQAEQLLADRLGNVCPKPRFLGSVKASSLCKCNTRKTQQWTTTATCSATASEPFTSHKTSLHCDVKSPDSYHTVMHVGVQVAKCISAFHSTSDLCVLQEPLPEEPAWWELFRVKKEDMYTVARQVHALFSMPKVQYISVYRSSKHLQSPKSSETVKVTLRTNYCPLVCWCSSVFLDCGPLGASPFNIAKAHFAPTCCSFIRLGSHSDFGQTFEGSFRGI